MKKYQIGLATLLVLCLAPGLSPAAPATQPGRTPDSASTPAPRPGPDWRDQHKNNLKQTAAHKDTQLIFAGDSIMDYWQNFPSFKENYGKYNALDLGVAGDKTENLLWRLNNGEIDGIAPKVAIVLIGTNNAIVDQPEWTAAGVRRIVQTIHQKLPKTRVLLLAIFPRDDKGSRFRTKNDAVNLLIAKLADDKTRFLDISKNFLDENGEIPKDIMEDQTHPTPKGYEIWAKAMQPALDEMMKGQ